MLVLLVALAGCGDSGDDEAVDRRTAEPEAMEVATGHRLVVADQTTEGDDVLVDEVVVAEGGAYVAVYREVAGAPGERLGVSPLLASGNHEDLLVPLTTALVAPASAFVILHAEADGDDVLDWPGPDEPVTDDAGAALTVPVRLELEL